MWGQGPAQRKYLSSLHVEGGGGEGFGALCTLLGI